MSDPKAKFKKYVGADAIRWKLDHQADRGQDAHHAQAQEPSCTTAAVARQDAGDTANTPRTHHKGALNPEKPASRTILPLGHPRSWVIFWAFRRDQNSGLCCDLTHYE